MRHTDDTDLQAGSDPLSSGEPDDWRMGAATGHLHIEVVRLRSENLALRSLLARSHAELIETRLVAGRGQRVETPDRDDTVQALRTQLAAAAVALADAHTAFREATAQIAELSRSLDEKDEVIRGKELLNREIDHRIRNSLQDIVSLLHIQRDHQKSPQAQAFITLACTRLQALATMHDLLHTGGGSDAIDFRIYLDRLCGCLRGAMAADGKRRTLILEAESLMLPCETAQALALAVNELVTNAFRHAFPAGGPGTVWVQLSRRGKTALLTVSDDGRGVPKGFDLATGDGLGLRLVTMMAGQLRAKVAVSEKGGARFTIAVPLPFRQGRGGNA